MSLIRVANPEQIRPGHVVMIVLIGLTLAGACLLTSGAPPTVLPDGARDWPADSLFRVLVELLNLNNTQPTPYGSEIKNLVFSLGTAIAVLSVGIGLAWRPRRGEEVEEGDTVISESPADETLEPVPIRRPIPPVFAAGVLMLLYVAWSFLSCRWAGAPDIALYGSGELALYVLWCFALAYGLNRASATVAAVVLIVVLALTAAVAIAYANLRNPTLRAGYPIGNPTFLAACLLPGMLLAASVFAAKVQRFGSPHRARCVVVGLLCLGAVVLMGQAFDLTDSRGAKVGLICGFGALFFFALNRWGKLAVVVVALIGCVAGAWLMLPQTLGHSPTGRDASGRLRFYAWSYAAELIGDRPLLGHGQGGYVRKADALARGEDVLTDWEAFADGRLAHAHNEWLEVCTDLGSVGLVLVLASLLLTFVAGMRAVRTIPGLGARWVLIGLLASLGALVVEESTGVGLRVAGLPAIYYSVIGLTWAMCLEKPPKLIGELHRYRSGRIASTSVGVGLAFIVAVPAVRDFRSARAQFDVPGAIDQREWQRAIDLARTASAHRLSPQRRLEAMDKLAAAYLHIANEHRVIGLRRLAMAQQSDPPDAQLARLGEQDLQVAMMCYRQGAEALRDLVRKAPDFYNSYWLEYGFHQIRADLARIRGDVEEARQYNELSAVALKRELARRPCDANIAVRLISVAGSAMPLEDIWVVLARPLRFNPVPDAYQTVAAHLLTLPAFEEVFDRLWRRAQGARQTSDPAQWEDPFAPESLRLAAVVWTQQGDGDRAEAGLEDACALYHALRPRYAYGSAVCLAELAQRRFFNRPLNPRDAMAAVGAAIERAPPSNDGRQLVRWALNLLLTMQLAGGDEAAARNTIEKLAPGLSESSLPSVLGNAYMNLIAGLLPRERSEGILTSLARWFRRAAELDDQNPVVWLQGAEITFRQGDDVECVRCLREAVSRGMDVGVVANFVESALERRPGSAPLLEYRDRLGTASDRQPAESGPGVDPAGAQQGGNGPVLGGRRPGEPSDPTDEPAGAHELGREHSPSTEVGSTNGA